MMQSCFIDKRQINRNAHPCEHFSDFFFGPGAKVGKTPEPVRMFYNKGHV